MSNVRKLSQLATPGPYYLVGQPWRYPDVSTYAVAGHPDPHRGRPFLDSMQNEFDANGGDETIQQADGNLEFAVAACNMVPAVIEVHAALKKLAEQPIPNGLPIEFHSALVKAGNAINGLDAYLGDQT